MIRNLTKYEGLQVDLAEIYHNRNLDKSYNYTRLVVLILLVVLFLVVIILFDKYWFSLIAKIGIVIVPFVIWINHTNYTSSQKSSKRISNFIKKVRSQDGIETEEYSISKAVYFQIFEDEGDCFALEIENEEKILFLWDYVYFDSKSNFPSTRVEVYKSDCATEVFGKSVISSGKLLEPICISGDIKWKVLDILPQNKEVIDYNLDKLFDKIKIELKK